MTHLAESAGVYEPPRLDRIGTVHELTLEDWPCIYDKTIGPPDYVNWIPITNCS